MLSINLISPFIQDKLTETPLKSIDSSINELDLEIKDCDRQLEMVHYE